MEENKGEVVEEEEEEEEEWEEEEEVEEAVWVSQTSDPLKEKVTMKWPKILIIMLGKSKMLRKRQWPLMSKKGSDLHCYNFIKIFFLKQVII